MSKTRTTIFLICISFLALGSCWALYTETQDIQQQKEAIDDIVRKDLTTAMTLLCTSEEMTPWAEYLGIEAIQTTMDDNSPHYQNVLDSVWVRLSHGYGVEKYPELCALRDSLTAMRIVRTARPYQTLFRTETVPEKLLATRHLTPVVADPAGMEMPATEVRKLQADKNANTEIVLSVLSLLPEEKVERTSIVSQDSGPVENVFSLESQNMQNAPASILETAESERVQRSPLLSLTKHASRTAVAKEVAEIDVKSEEKLNFDDMEQPELLEEEACTPIEVTSNASKNTTPKEKTELEATLPEIILEADGNETSVTPPVITAQNTPSDKTSDKNSVQNNPIPSQEEIVATESAFQVGTLPALPWLHFSLEEPVQQAIENVADVVAEKNQAGLVSLSDNFVQNIDIVRKAWATSVYQVPKEHDLEVAYTAVCDAGHRIDAIFSKVNKKKRQEWLHFLLWESLDFSSPADVNTLKDVQKRLCSGALGLELDFFVRMRDAIAHYLAVEAQIQEPIAAQELYNEARQRMIALLTLAEQNNTSEIQRAIADMVAWFTLMGQSKELIVSTCQIWSKPNFTAHVSASVFENFGSLFIEEELDVREQLQRATIRGKALFSGNVSVEPIANENQIQLGIVLEGGVDSKTHAYQGPAIVSSRARSRFLVTKNVFFDENGITTSPAKVRMRTNSRIENVQDVYDRPIIESIITRRAFAKKEEKEQAANTQSSFRMRKRFNDALDPMLSDWNERFATLFHRHLEPHGLIPERMRMWSDDTGVHALTSLTGRSRLAAPTPAEKFPQACDIQIEVHESLFHNIGEAFFSGLNLSPMARKQLEETAPEWLQMKGTTATNKSEDNVDGTEKKDTEDWTVCYAKNWPLVVSFDDGKVSLCLRCDKIEYDGKSYPAVNLNMTYEIENRDDTITLVRQGNIEILPPDFNPAVKKRLPASMVSLRRVMAKRLQNVIPSELVLHAKPVVKNSEDSTSRFANIRIKPVVVKADNGWLQVGFNLDKVNEDVPAKP